MSTAPTLEIDGNDLTAYAQHKSWSVKLNSVDVTLIDSPNVPALGDTVAITDPTWSGTVAQVESVGYKGDVPFLKVRAKNTTALPDLGPAPFDLSDNANESTTFGHKNLTITRTRNGAADEMRASCIVFEPGLLAGHEIEITSVVEGLSAETFTIRDLTVEWTKDDQAVYTLQMALGGFTESSTSGPNGGPTDPVHLDLCCDEDDDDEWVCAPSDLTVQWDPGGLGGFAQITDPTFAELQEATTVSTTDGGGTMTLYGGATYTAEISGYPGSLVDPETGIPEPYVGDPDWGWITAGIDRPGAGDGVTIDMGAWPEGAIPGSPPKFFHQFASFTMSMDRPDMRGYVQSVNDVAHNGYLWSSTFSVKYVSGPDPRFVDLPACSNGAPRIGQRVRQASFVGDGFTTEFTSDWPYTENTLTVIVNGLDLTNLVTQTDPTTGDFTMAYPFPLGATVVIRYRRLS